MVTVTLSVEEYCKWTKEKFKTSLTNKRKNENGCDSIWKKGERRKHKKLLNIKNINLIKICLKFFSRSSLPSGKNAKLISMTHGPSQFGLCLQRQSNLFPPLCFESYPAILNSFPRASCSLTPFHAAPFSRFNFRVQCLQEAFSDSHQLGKLYSLCTPKAPWASQYHSIFHTVYSVKTVIDCLPIYLPPSTLSSFPAGMDFIHSCIPCA